MKKFIAFVIIQIASSAAFSQFAHPDSWVDFPSDSPIFQVDILTISGSKTGKSAWIRLVKPRGPFTVYAQMKFDCADKKELETMAMFEMDEDGKLAGNGSNNGAPVSPIVAMEPKTAYWWLTEFVCRHGVQ